MYEEDLMARRNNVGTFEEELVALPGKHIVYKLFSDFGILIGVKNLFKAQPPVSFNLY